MAVNKHRIDDAKYFARLGARIKKLRIDADYASAESFAGEIGMNRTQYLNYEKGRNMEIATLRKLAGAFNMRVEELLSGLEDKDE